MTQYTSTMPFVRSGFRQLLRAEWTKFRTVRGWLIGIAVAVLLMVFFGLLGGTGDHHTAAGGGASQAGDRSWPTGPDGEAVTDSFFFVRQSLSGDGTITARVNSLTGVLVSPDGAPPVGNAAGSAVQPWTKAGLIIKANTEVGSAYAAIMVTGGHGVRMQDNFTGDTAGPAGVVSATSPRWLRLVRGGNTITGYASVDGSRWTTVGAVRLAGLAATVPVGLFVASPDAQEFDQHLGGYSVSGQPSLATATFDSVDLQGRSVDGTWRGGDLGADPNNKGASTGRFESAGGTFTVTGSGDIAPDVRGTGHTIERTLIGAFAALTVLVVLGVLFMTTEYRRGLIRTTLAASPRRGRMLAAKALVMGAVAFVTGLVGAAITVPVSERILRDNGEAIYPVTWLTELRIVAGTAALLAVTAILAVAVGTILRRSAGAVATVIVVTVLPYILAVSAVLPVGPAQWLLQVTPAAAFAIQQSITAYPQVSQAYTPPFGFYPLGPWTGFAVLCGWAALALAVAGYLLRRRDV